MASLDDLGKLASAEKGLAVVSTLRTDGSIQASVVNAGIMASPITDEFAVVFVAMAGSAKLRNLRRKPNATVVFRAGWEWTAAEGPATLIGPDDPQDVVSVDLAGLLRDIFSAAGGTHDDWDEFDRAMDKERRTAVIVEIERVYGDLSASK